LLLYSQFGDVRDGSAELVQATTIYLPGGSSAAIGHPQAMSIVKRMGVGSAKALRGANLTLPAGA
jgi:hypothetical protein